MNKIILKGKGYVSGCEGKLFMKVEDKERFQVVDAAAVVFVIVVVIAVVVIVVMCVCVCACAYTHACAFISLLYR